MDIGRVSHILQGGGHGTRGMWMFLKLFLSGVPFSALNVRDVNMNKS